MTKTQMLKRFEELGGVTKRSAIQITREKYRDMIKSGHIVFGLHYPFSSNCGLCEYQQKLLGKNGYYCKGCALRPKRRVITDCGCCPAYGRLMQAMGNDNKPAYLAACQGILDKLKGQR